jgi:hypothetical protein
VAQEGLGLADLVSRGAACAHAHLDFSKSKQDLYTLDHVLIFIDIEKRSSTKNVSNRPPNPASVTLFTYFYH